MPTLTLQRIGHVEPLPAHNNSNNTTRRSEHDGVMAASSSSPSALPSSRLHAYVHVLPRVLLLASACVSRNQCVLRLLDTSTRSDAAAQTRQQSMLTELRATFHAPRTVQLHDKDEGVVTALEFVVEAAPQSHNNNNSSRAEDGAAAVCVLLLIGTSNGTVLVCNALQQTIVFMAQYQYHTRFGLDDMSAVASSSNNNSNSNGADVRVQHDEGGGNNTTAALLQQHAVNQRVACFATVRRHTPPAMLLMSSSSSSCRRAADGDDGGGGGYNSSNCKADDADEDEAAPLYSVGRGVEAVYVVHDKGKVVVLGRDVLDVCVDVVARHDDARSRRPHFVLDWSPNSNISSYPLAGPAAARVASLVTSVYTLQQQQQQQQQQQTMTMLMQRRATTSLYTHAEQCATTHNAAAAASSSSSSSALLPPLVCDAVVRTMSPLDTLADIATAAAVASTADLSAMLMTTHQQHQQQHYHNSSSSGSGGSGPTAAVASSSSATLSADAAVATTTLCVCGRSPAVALYTLQRTHAAFSPRRTVAAVSSLVAGVARTLWRSAWRSRSSNNNDKEEDDVAAAAAAAVVKDEARAHSDGTSGGGDGDNNSATRNAERSTAAMHAAPLSSLSSVLPQSPPRRLDKLPQQPRTSQLLADMTFASVALDPSQRWLALCTSSSNNNMSGSSSSAGRVYVCDAQTSVVCRVLKGCRAAQCTWWWWQQPPQPSSSSSSSCVRLLLVVHLPLRHAVELYSMRTHARVAACAVPRGSVLLRSSCTCRVCSSGGRGGGAGQVLWLTPGGDVLRLTLCGDDKAHDDSRGGAGAHA